MNDKNEKKQENVVIDGYFKGNDNHPADEEKKAKPEKEDYKTLSVDEIKDLCPLDYNHHQQTVWLEIAGMVNDAGHLVSKNMLRIKQIVPMICIFRDSYAQVGEEGLTWETGTKGRNGNQKKPHALLPTITAYNKEINSFIAAFGLDPVSEARLKDPRQGEFDLDGAF